MDTLKQNVRVDWAVADSGQRGKTRGIANVGAAKAQRRVPAAKTASCCQPARAPRRQQRMFQSAGSGAHANSTATSARRRESSASTATTTTTASQAAAAGAPVLRQESRRARAHNGELLQLQ
jgi:hypothetical protein